MSYFQAQFTPLATSSPVGGRITRKMDKGEEEMAVEAVRKARRVTVAYVPVIDVGILFHFSFSVVVCSAVSTHFS